MDVTFIPTTNLSHAAAITYENMRIYYAQFAPDWTVDKVLSVTSDLENYDILLNKEVVGVMRLHFNLSTCMVRDLQVIGRAQNKGIGMASLQEAQRLALKAKKNTLSLRVFKISPAVNLYLRGNFVIESEDERFFNMVKNV